MKEKEANAVIQNYEDINYDDIPKITDFSKGRKNPFAGKFKNGYTIIVEHEDHEEVIEVKKSRREKQVH